MSDLWIGGVATCQTCWQQYTSSTSCPHCARRVAQVQSEPQVVSAWDRRRLEPCVFCGQVQRGGYCGCV